ncbi:MAG: hypothetical protein MK095_04700 [Phycisphaerales bacterium]|nr:hypothetical protein [Phycisphaerales bacterium]
MPSERLATTLMLGALITTALQAGGCDLLQRTTVDQTILQAHPGEIDDFDFWDALAEQAVVSNDDALHSLILMSDGRDPSSDFSGRMAIAAEKGWLAGTSLPLEANESASVGVLSVAGCNILTLKGGLTMRVFGPSPRYCTRELASLGILPDLTPNEALTGLEFIAFMNNIEDRLELQEAWAQREAMSTRKDDTGNTP